MATERIVGECRTYLDQVICHDHSYAQLIIPLQGTLFIETSAHQCELKDNFLFFLPPFCQHTFYAQERNKFLVLDIPIAMLPTRNIQSVRGSIKVGLDERWQALRSLISLEIQQVNYSLTNLFHYAYYLLEQSNVPVSICYIQENYHSVLSVEQLAKLEGYSLTYYSEWFKFVTGTTPKMYIQTLRLSKAKELLQYTDLPIWQIAQQVGYEHHTSLTRLFKQFEHLTPDDYRRQVRDLDKHNLRFG